jgi:hypothetical protein
LAENLFIELWRRLSALDIDPNIGNAFTGAIPFGRRIGARPHHLA